MKKSKPKFYVAVMEGIRGWFACMMIEEDGFPEPWQSGILSFKTRAKAVTEGKIWAEAEGVEYKGGD